MLKDSWMQHLLGYSQLPVLADLLHIGLWSQLCTKMYRFCITSR